MKLSKAEIEKLEEESWYDLDTDPCLPDSYLIPKKQEIANQCNVNVRDVEISWCAPVDEYCIYIKKRWSGYLDWSDAK